MQRVQGFAQQGDQQVFTAGLESVTLVMGSYPGAIISVFFTGTTDLAVIFSDNASTPLSNPFTADANGHWFFYAVNGRYDVQIAAIGGEPPPWTMGDILLADPESGGDLKVVQWLVFGTGGYMQMIGVSHAAVWPDLFTRMRAVRDSVDPK